MTNLLIPAAHARGGVIRRICQAQVNQDIREVDEMASPGPWKISSGGASPSKILVLTSSLKVTSHAISNSLTVPLLKSMVS